MLTYLRVINAAIRRYHIEKPIRDQFMDTRTQRKMSFHMMVRKLAKRGKITLEAKKHLIKQYRLYSATLHGRDLS